MSLFYLAVVVIVAVVFQVFSRRFILFLCKFLCHMMFSTLLRLYYSDKLQSELYYSWVTFFFGLHSNTSFEENSDLINKTLLRKFSTNLTTTVSKAALGIGERWLIRLAYLHHSFYLHYYLWLSKKTYSHSISRASITR